MADVDLLGAVTGVLTNAANAAVAAKYQHPYDLAKLKIEAMAGGKWFPEGQPAGALALPSGLLLWGMIAAVVFVIVKK